MSAVSNIVIAKADTYVTLHPEDNSIPSAFEDLKGRRIAVVHGSDGGQWPTESSEWIRKHNPDLIYCCHPRQMKAGVGDPRIQGNFTCSAFVRVRSMGNGQVVIYIHKDDRA